MLLPTLANVNVVVSKAMTINQQLFVANARMEKNTNG
jgi:hypothetical protein